MVDLTNKNVIHIKKNEIQYLQFKKLLEYKSEIQHAYSLGLSTNYRTTNKEKSEYETTIENYKHLCESINTNYINIVKPNQEHTDEVKIIDKKINIDGPDFNLSNYWNTDGLITNKRKIILSTTNADCILLLFYDPITKTIANVHSGWKGTLKRISIKTIEKMEKNFNCNPKDIICCICPSIRKCHFEVDKDVEEIFEKNFRDLGKENLNNIIQKQQDKEKWNIDTVLINKLILKSKGLKEKNIIDSEICSVCNCDLIHSYRVEKQGYKLNTSLISIK